MSASVKTRRTAQKAIILEVLGRVGRHISAEELHAIARGSLPRLSIGTVYRNLKRMVRDGRVQQISGADGRLLFEIGKGPHNHLRCLDCGAVVDYEMDTELERAVSAAAAGASGFVVKNVYVDITGFCPSCQGRLSGTNRSSAGSSP